MNIKINKLIQTVVILFIILGLTSVLNARTKVNSKDKNKKDEIQRTVTNTFDVQKNTVSNIEFYTSNYGIFGLDVLHNVGGGKWPRGSLNQYIFGGGIWFAAQKFLSWDPIPHKLVELTYNPNNGRSWMVPGRIDDGDLVNESELKKYRTYFSTDFRVSDGNPLNADDGTNWPIWDSSTNPEDTLKNNRYFGFYVPDELKRNKTEYPKGPAFISGEDIFATYKDTDLSFFDGGIGVRQPLGYPLRLQFEQTIYSWGFGDYKDFIFLKYDIINFSSDTLWNCWMAPMMDVDIGRTDPTPVANNDKCKYYDADPSLNLAMQWTYVEGASGEKGYGFGYLGFDFLESPAVYRCEEEKDTTINGTAGTYCLMCVDTKDTVIMVRDSVDTNKYNPKTIKICAKKIAFSPGQEQFVRKDRKVFDNKYQLGLITFKNWNIEEDYSEDEARYNVMSSGVKDGDNGQGDKRFMMATGPFHIQPKDTVRVVVGIILANPAIQKDADGTNEDAAELVRKDKFAQEVYDNNFKAPTPPNFSVFNYDKYGWRPLNNGVIIGWDSSAEISEDSYEKGLDFMGYKLYRARRTNLDTFDVNQLQPSNQYTSGKGPFGWKQLAQWVLPTPFYKSYNRAGTNPDNSNMPMIDSLRIVGPNISGGQTDTFSIKLMRIGRGFMLAYPESWVNTFLRPITNGYSIPVIMGIDTALLAEPWGKYFAGKVNQGDYPLYHDPFNPNSKRHFLLDDVSIGVVSLNKALITYNPLFWRKETVSIADTSSVPERDQDTIYFKNTFRNLVLNGVATTVVDRMIPYNINQAMKDTVHLRAVLDSVYSYIQRGIGKVVFPSFEQSAEVRNNVIAPYMRKITNNRTFVDIGDDNHSGNVQFDDDPTKTEKLINNIDYFYKLLAYDEGDYSQPTPSKLNFGFVGLSNVVEATPNSESAMKPIKFDVMSVDSAKIGGLYNFRMYSIDPDRVQQLFAGHELEMEFLPSWDYRTIQLFNNPRQPADPIPTKQIGWYRRLLILKDLTTNKEIFNGWTWLEQDPCILNYRTTLTEDASSSVLADVSIQDTISQKPIEFGVPNNNEKYVRTGTFSTGEFTVPGYCYTSPFSQEGYGTLGFSFDYTVEQRGGRYRPDSTSGIVSGNSTTPVTFITDIPSTVHEPDKVITSQAVDFQVVRQVFTGYPDGRYTFLGYGQPVYASFNNGPAEYLVEFQPGGTDVLNLSWDNGAKTKAFNVNYLNLKVTNSISYKRPGEKGDVDVTYPGELQHLFIDIDTLADPQRLYPDPRNLRSRHDEFIGKYNLSSYGFIDARTSKGFRIARQSAVPADGPRTGMKKTFVGAQGRYYLTGYSQDGKDTVDFTNVFMGSGCFFVFDYARKERRWDQAEWNLDSAQKADYGVDFSPGDKVLLKTTGGALGLPLPGAKVKFRIDSSVIKPESYTDDILDQVGVVPNPYFITHEGQKSPYDAKIFFTRLPKVCNIDIYTITGDLVISLHHDENLRPSPANEGIEEWNLLTKNNLRVQSQALVAVVTTPNGSKAIKNFSVIVGGSRIVPEK